MPVASVSLMGGQYFLEGSAASFGGRANAFVSPVVKISEGQELVPVYSGSYYGTQDIQELAGGGVLTRHRQSHTLSLAYAYAREFDHYKPRISITKGLARETTDETWGKGLFDADTLSAGFEAEQERPWGTLTESYDFTLVKYPNYDSLLSQSQGVLDAQTFTELSQNSGKAVLDNQSHRLSFGLDYFKDPVIWSPALDLALRSYPDQAVVGELGNFLSQKRSDTALSLSGRVVRDMRPLRLGLSAAASLLASNQNSYDASRTKFIGDYYDYTELALAPSLGLRLKNGGSFSFETGWTKRFYGGRLAQRADGSYSGSRVHQTTWLTALSYRQPVLQKRLFFRLAASYTASSSNMRYESNYRYNYRANTYMLGLEWEL